MSNFCSFFEIGTFLLEIKHLRIACAGKSLTETGVDR